MQIVDIIKRAKEAESKDELIAASFSSWQIIETLKGLTSKNSKPTKFIDYLKRIGLADKEKADPKTAKAKKTKALQTAEEIKALDEQRQQQEGGS